MTETMRADLVAQIKNAFYDARNAGRTMDQAAEDAADRAVTVFRDQRIRCPIHDLPDCSPLLNGCSLVNQIYTWRSGL